MGHITVSATKASSVTPQVWQHGAKMISVFFANFNRIVYTRTNIIIQMEQNIVKQTRE